MNVSVLKYRGLTVTRGKQPEDRQTYQIPTYKEVLKNRLARSPSTTPSIFSRALPPPSTQPTSRESDEVQTLIKKLKSSDRINAAFALGKIGPKAAGAVPALIEALKDSDPRVRGNAAKALGEIGPKAARAVPVLIKALKDDNNYVRKEAADALKKIRGK